MNSDFCGASYLHRSMKGDARHKIVEYFSDLLHDEKKESLFVNRDLHI